MALPSAGNSISLKQVNVELGETATDAINMGGSAVRGLFGISSGAIDMSDGFGKSSELGLNASAASSANLKTLFDNATSGSWAADGAKRYTVADGVDMGVLTAPASMGGTLIIDIVSGGTVRGTRGTGGAGGGANAGTGAAGVAGGTAMTVSSTGITVNVEGSLQGGGGGSGGGGGGGQGGTGIYNTRSSTCGNAPAYLYCVNDCVSCCDGGEQNVYQCFGYQAGGAGGAGATGVVGAGFAGAAASAGGGSSGAGGSNGSGAGGTGGNSGAGGAFGTVASNSSAGAAGANGNSANGSGGGSVGAAGAAGRAITFSGVSAYTIIGTSGGTIAGAYN